MWQTTQCLINRGQEPKTCNLQLMFLTLTPVTLNQSQGHQTYHDDLDPKQGYNHEKFERSCLDGAREKKKGQVKVFFPNEDICQLSPFNICEKQK